MKFIAYLEKNNIATKETLRIFAAILFLYWLSWIFLRHHLSWWALSSFLIVSGGTANLYVIDFNSLRMPVLARSRQKFNRIKGKNPRRRICMLNKRTRLGWLCDRFRIGKTIYSIGDFLVFFGIVMVFFPIVISAIALIL